MTFAIYFQIASKKSTSVNNIALNHHRRRISSPAASSTSSNSNHHHHHHHLSRFLRTIGINRHSSSTAENAVKLTSVVTSIATDDDRRHGQCRFRDGNRVFGKDLIKHLKETGHESTFGAKFFCWDSRTLGFIISPSISYHF